jgi:hypothetical protein
MERLWRRVDVRGPDECWLWQGPARPDGYGEIRVAAGDKQLVHRLVYADRHGPIPDGYDVHHWCETKLCCNPGPGHLEQLAHEEHSQLHRSYHG